VLAAARSKSLSVACLSSGRDPQRLAAILALFVPIADEIVVAVEEPRAVDTHAAVAGIADLVLSFPPTHPSDRPIPWLFGSCRCEWIFNVDDDEIPSPRLLEMLPAAVARDDITHAWVARRWLYPTTATYLDEAPWNTEFQLRLLLADPRFTQFSDVFHRPVVAQGPGVYVDGVLWHLDTATNPLSRRRSKAEAYELERPGMRIGGRSHNHAFYVPELTPEPRIAPVPPDEHAAIERVLSGGGRHERHDPPRLLVATAADVDAVWPGPSLRLGALHGRIEASSPPATLRARVQETVDVTITNESEATWRWGKDARPPIRLAYSWSRDGEAVTEPMALRTVLPADLEPGASQVVPVHVVPPAEPGRYELRLELVHEGVEVFAQSAPLELGVEPRERVALVGEPEEVIRLLVQLSAPPYVEPVIVLGNDSDRLAYGDYACISGLREPLLAGLEASGPLSRAFRLPWRSWSLTRAARRFRRRGSSGVAGLDDLCELLQDARGLFVAGTDWPPDAAPGREWWRLVTTTSVARATGCPVYVADGAVPSGSRVRDVVLRRILRRTSEPIGNMTLVHPASRLETSHDGTGAETPTGALV
jgi:hypothetical protein